MNRFLRSFLQFVVGSSTLFVGLFLHRQLASVSLESANYPTRNESSTVSQAQMEKWRRTLPYIKQWANTTTREFHSEILHTCSDEWTYIHVLKAGGTTVESQCLDGNASMHSDVYKTHKLFTFVRDPIDHYISGYKECADRRAPRHFKFLDKNQSLRLWINQKSHWCFQHSVPQIEYLLYRSEPLRFLDHISFVGDMKDLKAFFIQQGLPWKDENVQRRHSPIKARLASLRRKT